jgi:hypothetical protein
MELENQKFMAVEGLHTWATAVLVAVERMNTARSGMVSLHDHEARIASIRAFQRERHLFLISAN